VTHENYLTDFHVTALTRRLYFSVLEKGHFSLVKATTIPITFLFSQQNSSKICTVFSPTLVFFNVQSNLMGSNNTLNLPDNTFCLTNAGLPKNQIRWNQVHWIRAVNVNAEPERTVTLSTYNENITLKPARTTGTLRTELRQEQLDYAFLQTAIFDQSLSSVPSYFFVCWEDHFFWNRKKCHKISVVLKSKKLGPTIWASLPSFAFLRWTHERQRTLQRHKHLTYIFR